MAFVAAASQPAQGILNCLVYISTNRRARHLVCCGRFEVKPLTDNQTSLSHSFSSEEKTFRDESLTTGRYSANRASEIVTLSSDSSNFASSKAGIGSDLLKSVPLEERSGSGEE